MSETEKQEGQKTVVSFISGLLIGGLLVWAFSGSPADKKVTTETSDKTDAALTENTTDNTEGDSVAVETTKTEDKPAMTVGDGSITVNNQPAGVSVALTAATYPTDEGWIAVRSYQNDQLGSILGAARFSKSQGLVPQSVPLLAGTTAGNQYAVVFFSDDGNRKFNLDGDAQIDAGMATFTAQ